MLRELDENFIEKFVKMLSKICENLANKLIVSRFFKKKFTNIMRKFLKVCGNLEFSQKIVFHIFFIKLFSKFS